MATFIDQVMVAVMNGGFAVLVAFLLLSAFRWYMRVQKMWQARDQQASVNSAFASALNLLDKSQSLTAGVMSLQPTLTQQPSQGAPSGS